MSRKRRAAEAGAVGPAVELRWEWQDSGGTWHRFAPEESEVLTQAARAGKPSVAVGARVDLQRMVQQDRRTGQDRRVAAAVRDQDSFFVWCWQGDEEGQWVPYPAHTCLALEGARRGNGGPSLEVTLGRTRYTLDTAQMTQTNVRTGYQRQMERRESDAADDDAGAESSSVLGSSAPLQPPAPKRPRDGGTSPNPEGENTEVVRTLIVKGKAPVDPECSVKLGKAHVYCEGDDVYDVMLNQTNLQFNNNKFYLLQLLEDEELRSFSVWMRWGRVGRPGQHSLVSCAGDLTRAKETFTQKFFDKTRNHWAERDHFQKVPGKYDLVHVDTQPPAEERGAGEAPPSRLDPRLQAVLGLLYDLRAMEEMVLEMKYDAKKAPLGKLTAEQIRAGFQSLQKVEAALRVGGSRPGPALLEACNEFYTRVPHDFGLRPPPLIRTQEELQEKVQLLEALGEIRVAVRLARSELQGQEHPLERSYCALGCELHPLERDSAHFQVLERYLLSTHAPTHQDYTMELLGVFALRRAGAPAFRDSLPHRSERGSTSPTCRPRAPTTASPPAAAMWGCCCCARWRWVSARSCWRRTPTRDSCRPGSTAPRGWAGWHPTPPTASCWTGRLCRWGRRWRRGSPTPTATPSTTTSSSSTTPARCGRVTCCRCASSSAPCGEGLPPGASAPLAAPPGAAGAPPPSPAPAK
ncbi:poly [ADP-ribose] polymerase 2 isoform X2 [Carettochelys insculpta]|uniref:poly [ADP-ribose] polymerase 2 isoform X2 n=1 Tax=Carettochelys insculpta TaxID=44489 RepID=UPI003EBD8CEB